MKLFEAIDKGLESLSVSAFHDPAKRSAAVRQAISDGITATMKTGTYIVAHGKKAKQMQKDLNYTMFLLYDENVDYTDPVNYPEDAIRAFSCNQVITAVINGITYTRK